MSTIGLDEDIVRAYVRNQDAGDARYDQMKLFTLVRRPGRLMVFLPL